MRRVVSRLHRSLAAAWRRAVRRDAGDHVLRGLSSSQAKPGPGGRPPW